MEINFIFNIVILIASVIIHEVAHGYMANTLGDPTARYAGRLTLNPLKHIDPVGSVILPIISYLGAGFVFGWAKPVPYNPYNLRHGKWGEALVALVGPVSNLSIALVFSIIIRSQDLLGLNASFLEISELIVIVNIVLAVFNLVPIPPLDGSKVLFAILPYYMYGWREALEKYSLFLLIFFIFFLWKFLVPVVFIIFYLFTGSVFQF